MKPPSLAARNRADRLAARRPMLIANGHNPDALNVTLWRKPTPAELRFGEGAIHYMETVLPDGRTWVKIDGMRWNVLH